MICQQSEYSRARSSGQSKKLITRRLGDWSGRPVATPAGGFYLWIPVDDGWEFTERLARDGGAIVSPGEFYGDDGAGFVRVAVVQPDERVALVAERLGDG